MEPIADLPLETDLPRERVLLRRRAPPPSLSSITRTYAESKGFSNLVSSSFLQGAGVMHEVQLKQEAQAGWCAAGWQGLDCPQQETQEAPP